MIITNKCHKANQYTIYNRIGKVKPSIIIDLITKLEIAHP